MRLLHGQASLITARAGRGIEVIAVSARRRDRQREAAAVTAGTPAFRTALRFEPFTQLAATRHRVSPGTVIYHDQRSEQEDPGSGLVPAALLFTRVVSHPSAAFVTLSIPSGPSMSRTCP